MKLFPAKCHERTTLRKLWRQTGNSSLLPAKCWPLLHVIRGGLMSLKISYSAFFKICFCFVWLYNKSLNNWSFGEQWILFPSMFVSGNNKILGKQNSLFPKGPVIKCFVYNTKANVINTQHFSLWSGVTVAPRYNEDPVITNNIWTPGRITVKYAETNPAIAKSPL